MKYWGEGQGPVRWGGTRTPPVREDSPGPGTTEQVRAGGPPGPPMLSLRCLPSAGPAGMWGPTELGRWEGMPPR